MLVLDAGTGARRLGASLVGRVKRIDLLITHLHMDHIQGLGFFAPFYTPGLEVHLWGPASSTMSLRTRLGPLENLAQHQASPARPTYVAATPAPINAPPTPATTTQPATNKASPRS